LSYIITIIISKSAELLQQESGCTLEDRSVSQFRDSVLQGDWDVVETLLPQLGVNASYAEVSSCAPPETLLVMRCAESLRVLESCISGRFYGYSSLFLLPFLSANFPVSVSGTLDNEVSDTSAKVHGTPGVWTDKESASCSTVGAYACLSRS
jgi:hypothetical protein